MFSKLRILILCLLIIIPALPAEALPTLEGEIFGIYPVTNEVSFYRNVDDSGNDRGRTIQLIAINGLKIGTEFTFEFTGDFNWDMSYKPNDHYVELSLVKRIAGPVSVNYQRIYSTFEPDPVNQFGFRLSF